MKRIILMLTAVLPLLAFGQSVVITESLRLIESSSADVQYANEFGDFKNTELDEPFPYVVIRMELEGDVQQAKVMLSLDLGTNFKVEAKNVHKDNTILFLVKSSAKSIYLQCGDGCKEQELYYGALMANKVYACKVAYNMAKGDGASNDEMTRQMEEMKRQMEEMKQLLQNQQSTVSKKGAGQESVKDKNPRQEKQQPKVKAAKKLKTTKYPGVVIANGVLMKVPEDFKGEFVVGDDVTAIGDDAFEMCKGLTSVTISGSVETIGNDAFYGCYGLTNVTMNYGVIIIGDNAFRDCTSLTSVNIPNSVTSIGVAAFRNCKVLSDVTIPNSVTNVEILAFTDCPEITQPLYNSTIFIKLPFNYQGAYTIPSGITTIAGTAFYGCQSLYSVTIPNSVISIGESAFQSCNRLTNVTLPNSVTSIGNQAFFGCESIKEPLHNEHVFAYMPTSYQGAYTIPSGITSIAGAAFYKCTELTDIIIPNSIKYVGHNAFGDCDRITKPLYNSSIFIHLPDSFKGEYTIPANIKSFVGDAFSHCPYLTKVNIQYDMTVLDELYFSGCSSLTEITIPNGVKSIGVFAFNGCTSLTNVLIPNGVKSIENWAFSHCKSLTRINIPNSVTSIGDWAFESCTGLKEIKIPNSVLSIGFRAFEGCFSLTSITISNGLKTIASQAFYGCRNLTSVTIPNSVVIIEDHAFKSCEKMTSVNMSNSVVHIGEYAFDGCDNLTSITLPNTIEFIGESAFDYHLKTIYVPKGSKKQYKKIMSKYTWEKTVEK